MYLVLKMYSLPRLSRSRKQTNKGWSLVALLTALCLGWSSFVSAESAPAEAQRSAQDWLMKMQEASVQSNYKGTFVFTRGRMTSTVQIVHRYQDGVEQERLTQLDGEMGEIVRTGSEVMCVLPNNRVVKVEQDDKFSNRIVSAFSGFMPKHDRYELQVKGFQRLIGRQSVQVAVEAQDKDRLSYYLWLDKDTGLLLKSKVVDDKAQELERFHYTVLEFPETIVDEELNPISKGAVVSHKMIPTVKKDRMWPGALSWQVSWVPDGYSRISSMPKPGHNVQVYSDGLATFTVFVEQVESNAMPEGASIVGATVAYFHKVMTGDHHYGVTVMGEIPAMTAMMVAESVKPDMANEAP